MPKNNQKYLPLWAFLSSAALVFPTAMLGMQPLGHSIKFSVASMVYGALTYFLVRKSTSLGQKRWVAIAIAFPLAVCYGYIHILLGHADVSKPSTLALFLGIGVGYYPSFVTQPVQKGAIIAAMLIFYSWVTFKGYSYYIHYLNYDTLTGKIEKRLPPNLHFVDAQGRTLSEKDFKGKTVILDFWTTSCGVCFKKFPVLQERYEQAKTNPNLLVYAVNVPMKRDSAHWAFSMIQDEKYSFPVLKTTDEEILSQLNVQAYPTVIGIKDQRIFFRGDIEMLDDL